MKRTFVTVTLAGLFLGLMSISSLADSGSQMHSMDYDQSSTSMSGMHDMMGMSGMQRHDRRMDRDQMPCQLETGNSMMGMMGSGMHGMMGQRMTHMFFLDSIEELGLSQKQVATLKTLHTACRGDNIRNTAEVKIARLELADLLENSNWALKDAETLVRKIEKLEGDIKMRHLQGVTDARQVLTAEQLKQVTAGVQSGSLENLFSE